ncbi:hypothetical protein EV44_g3101 [Erysiphe necator]|uniref:Uncharacterized protein n=1 Tax=Uncinula necator TaxID=52586 RepID=A0A0B1P5P5_UNCNE|nr:hypothetical protein EV44_g3101 [Erysiphe necator]
MDKENNWGIPILSGDNHDSWFRRYKVKLTGKGVFYVVEQTVSEACRIASVDSLTKGVENLDLKQEQNSSTSRTEGIMNLEKREKYLRDEATAIDYLFKSLSLDDQALYDEHDTAYDLWLYLKKKYQQTDPTTANEYMTLIQTFTIGDMSIINAWDKLKDFRRKLCAADPEAKDTYRDRALLLILIRALPKDFTSTIDTLDAQPDLSVEEKLKRLQTKESRLVNESKQDQAFVGFTRNSESKPYMNRTRLQASEGDESGYTPECYICDRRHFVKACPFMEVARLAVQDYIRQEKLMKKHNLKPLPNSKNPSRPSSLPKHRKRTDLKKSRAYEALSQSNSDTEASLTSDESDECEHAQISRALISKVTPSTWVAKTNPSKDHNGGRWKAIC